MLIDPGFAPLLSAYGLDGLAESQQTIYAVDDGFRLRFVNRGWDWFATRNQGRSTVADWPLGRSILEAMPEVLRDFYRDALIRAAAAGAVFSHTYQCPTPLLERSFLLSAYPLGRSGWLLVHAEVFSGPHAGPALAFDPALHLDGHGIVHQCAHCRKVRRTTGPEHWDWLPMLVADPHPTTSHGLCSPCLGFYYPAA
jgi:hypothetical protein